MTAHDGRLYIANLRGRSVRTVGIDDLTTSTTH